MAVAMSGRPRFGSEPMYGRTGWRPAEERPQVRLLPDNAVVAGLHDEDQLSLARASDADRESVVAELRRHSLEGRITLEELEERLEAAMRARTAQDLALLLCDLPASGNLHSPEPARRAWRARSDDALPLIHRVIVPAGSGRTQAFALEKIAPWLKACGYAVVMHSAVEIIFERSTRPWWTVVAAVALFPIGLVALAHRTTDRLVIRLAPRADGRTMMSVHGRPAPRIRETFERLTF